jgi:hypothetical protein
MAVMQRSHGRHQSDGGCPFGAKVVESAMQCRDRSDDHRGPRHLDRISGAEAGSQPASLAQMPTLTTPLLRRQVSGGQSVAEKVLRVRAATKKLPPRAQG